VLGLRSHDGANVGDTVFLKGAIAKHLLHAGMTEDRGLAEQGERSQHRRTIIRQSSEQTADQCSARVEDLSTAAFLQHLPDRRALDFGARPRRRAST
jgi:hypothetical protein